jgi:hypothetical protein
MVFGEDFTRISLDIWLYSALNSWLFNLSFVVFTHIPFEEKVGIDFDFNRTVIAGVGIYFPDL